MNSLETAIKQVLLELGVNLEDPNFKDTPKRVAGVYSHFFRNEKERVLSEIKQKVFPSEDDEVVIVKNIKCFGMCPHHLVPVIYNMAIGYIPDGMVIGLSKLARLAKAVCSFPKLQEDITKEIVDEVENMLHTQGVMVVVKGVHGCMQCRGVEMDAVCVTSNCRGSFRKDPAARAEFLSLISK